MRVLCQEGLCNLSIVRELNIRGCWKEEVTIKGSYTDKVFDVLARPFGCRRGSMLSATHQASKVRPTFC